MNQKPECSKINILYQRGKLRTGWTSTDCRSHTGAVRCPCSSFDLESRR